MAVYGYDELRVWNVRYTFVFRFALEHPSVPVIYCICVCVMVAKPLWCVEVLTLLSGIGTAPS